MSRRFVELRDGCDYLVLDMKDTTYPVIVCKCEGFNAPLNAEYVAAALQSYHDHLIERVMGGGDAGMSPRGTLSEPPIAPSDIEGAGC